jgi:hypothetical protein
MIEMAISYLRDYFKISLAKSARENLPNDAEFFKVSAMVDGKPMEAFIVMQRESSALKIVEALK